jgi:amidophosphoribosyltransferase
MCGFVGTIGPEKAAHAIFIGLQAIQHRGQDAAGIGSSQQPHFFVHKDLGLTSEVFSKEDLDKLQGKAAVGHVRYPTAGFGTRDEAQPFLTLRPGILLAHNGNLTNVAELEEMLLNRGVRLLSRSDAEPLLQTFTQELLAMHEATYSINDVVTALKGVMTVVKGAYSAAAIMEIDGQEALIAFRDPHGIRPCIYGQDAEGSWMVASESVAFDATGFKPKGFVPAGHMVLLRKGDEPITRSVLPKATKHCVFEQIYFARADSIMEKGRINSVRWQMGQALAKQWAQKGFSADIITAVPDTSRPAAMAMAEALDIPYREGFIKNRYSRRTFIMPNQSTREAALRLKLNPLAEAFDGKRAILLDDSIVRGSTMRHLVKMVRTMNPTEIHLAVVSPAVRYPCFYGIDMPSKEELIAGHYDLHEVEQKIKEQLGVDSLTFLSMDALRTVVGDDLCSACFDGNYVVDVSSHEQNTILKQRRRKNAPASAAIE